MQTTQPLSSVEAFALALMEASSRLPSSAAPEVGAPLSAPLDADTVAAE
ncbi:MAG: hypothetical protein IT294_01000 [Deltaproteobacteria bacterium]|nr:hypothetical protein [Deltaproteobacteria bacterium]